MIKGIVKREYQDAWHGLSYGVNAHPAKYLVEPILEEMEASGWTSSKSWDQFDKQKIEEALLLARNGELEEIMYGKRPVFDNETIILPNADFSTRVVELYNMFKISSYDKRVIMNHSPIDIAGVFDYANEVEDPETMFHIFYKGSDVDWTLEQYMRHWKKGISLFEDATRIEFSGDQIERNDRLFYSNIRVFGGEWEKYVGVVLDENMWHVTNAWLEPLPSTYEVPDMLIDNGYTGYIGDLYNYLSNSKDQSSLSHYDPIAIVQLYFYIGELGDFETQYELFYQGEHSNVISKEQYLKDVSEGPQWNMKDMYNTIAFKGQPRDENGNWPGVATLTVNMENNPEAAPVQTIDMTWTRLGWRINYNPAE